MERLKPLHLPVLQFHGGRAAEDGHEDLELAFIGIDLLDRAVEIHERPFLDPYALALLENDLRSGLLLLLLGLLDDAVDLGLFQRRGLAAGADEAGHARRVLDQVPGLVVHLHLDQHVTGEKFPRRDLFLAGLDLGDLLHRDQHLADLLLQVELLGAGLERGLHAVLVAGLRVDHVPALDRGLHVHRSILDRITENTRSHTPTNAETINIVASTTMVEPVNSSRVGQGTFRISSRPSHKNTCSFFFISSFFYKITGAAGIEPAVPVLETGGLPLTDAPNSKTFPSQCKNRKKNHNTGLLKIRYKGF